MDTKIKDVMVEATQASDEERVTFGEVVMKLMQAGVERYHTDLLRGEKTYYLPNGESEVVAGDLSVSPPRANFRLPAWMRPCVTSRPAKFSIAHSARASRRPGAWATTCLWRGGGPSITAAPATATSNGFRAPSARRRREE
jgi:hypothetical protein